MRAIHGPLLLLVASYSSCSAVSSGPWKVGPGGESYKAVPAGLPGRVSISMCEQDICASMGGTLADIPNAATNDWLYDEMVRSGVEGAFFGLHVSPDAYDVAEPRAGYTWSTNRTDAYRNWAVGDLPEAADRCATMSTFYEGGWADINCAGNAYTDGCLCKLGAPSPTFISVLDELDDPLLEAQASYYLTAASQTLVLALVLSWLAPRFLRHVLQPFVRRAATSLYGTSVDNLADSTHSSGREGSDRYPGGGGEVINKHIPPLAIRISAFLDSAASVCTTIASILVILTVVNVLTTVTVVVYYTLNLGGDPTDEALAWCFYVVVVLLVVMVGIATAGTMHLAGTLLQSMWPDTNEPEQARAASASGVHPEQAMGGTSSTVAPAKYAAGTAPSASAATEGSKPAASPNASASGKPGISSDDPPLQPRSDHVALEDAQRGEPYPAFEAMLLRSTRSIISSISKGQWGTPEEYNSVLAKAGLALDIVIEQEAMAPTQGQSQGRRRSSHKNKASRMASQTCVKELQALLFRFPRSHAKMDTLLAPYGLRWTGRPRRAQPTALERWRRRWKDVTAGIADSSLFTSSGIWISPQAVVVFYAIGTLSMLLFGVLFLVKPTNVFFASGMVNGVLILACAIRLARGDRLNAKRLLMIAAGLPLALGWGTLTVITKADGHFSAGVGVLGWGAAIIGVGLIVRPRYSWYFLYAGLTVAFTLSAIAQFAFPLATTMAGVFAFLGTSSMLKRRHALANAGRLVAADAEAYGNLWDEKRSSPGLADLHAAWAEYCDVAVKEPKRQPNVLTDVEELFIACDRLNEPFLLKLRAICDAHGGVFHRANVKGEDRALQKVFRSYDEYWSRLTDLNRCGLAFERFDQIAACLRAIIADPEIVVLSMNKNKMRFDDAFDATNESGGYRDVQISVRIDNAWTREQGLAGILCEVQLHQEAFYQRKTMGGGHKAYVQMRNMLGQ